MLNIKNQEYFDQVLAFAVSVGADDKLQKQLDYLGAFGGTPTYATCELRKDFAPHSFAFSLYKNCTHWFSGGLIYSGPGQPLDGSSPALTVSLSPQAGHNWSVHT